MRFVLALACLLGGCFLAPPPPPTQAPPPPQRPRVVKAPPRVDPVEAAFAAAIEKRMPRHHERVLTPDELDAICQEVLGTVNKLPVQWRAERLLGDLQMRNVRKARVCCRALEYGSCAPTFEEWVAQKLPPSCKVEVTTPGGYEVRATVQGVDGLLFRVHGYGWTCTGTYTDDIRKCHAALRTCNPQMPQAPFTLHQEP